MVYSILVLLRRLELLLGRTHPPYRVPYSHILCLCISASAYPTLENFLDFFFNAVSPYWQIFILPAESVTNIGPLRIEPLFSGQKKADRGASQFVWKSHRIDSHKAKRFLNVKLSDVSF
jgi:hypothetical protein